MITKNKRGWIKLSAAFAIFAVLFILFACVKGDNKNNDAGAEENNKSAAAADEVSETEEQSPVPKDVQFGGEEIRILNCTYYAEDIGFVNAEEEIGEVVNDEIYRRNFKVQSDLNVGFKFTDIALSSGGDFQRIVKNSVSSGSDDYDILFGVQYNCVQLVTSNVFANLINAPYIDLNKSWWAARHIRNELTIGKDALYFLTGDISLNFVRNMSCVYFNKQLYSDYFGDPDDMYKTVLDGKWTLDKLSETVKTMYKDLNGDGAADDGDQYGCGVLAANLTDHFMFDAGVRMTARDEEDVPYLVINNERTVNFTDKLYKLYYENEGVRVFPAANETNNITIPAKFMNNELLFDFGWFYISELLRDMNSDYGIIPFPKYDENQSSYLSLAHDIVPLYCVPTTCIKMECVGAVLEVMAFESYKTVLPAYFEIALKSKYTRDVTEDAFKIIDMIHDNATTDFAYVYNYALNNIGNIMRELMSAKSGDFVSKYQKIEPMVQKSMEKLIDTYLQNN